MRKLFLRDQIVKILLEQTITDSNSETIKDGWALLKSLAVHEEGDFCVHLHRLDVLKAIQGIVGTVSIPLALLQFMSS